jgi:formylglycine-generating enzyme required for sulfatase activity
LVESRLLRVEEEEVNLIYELVHDYLLDEIEISPEVQDRKAAQELLEREVKAYEQYKRTLVGAERLDIIEAQGAHLALNIASLDLLFRSTLALGRRPRVWRDYAVRRGLTPILADRWVLTLEDETKADTAIKLLASLSDAAAVARLADFIASHSLEGRVLSLDSLSSNQQKALVALAQMECEEAEAYLRELTPDGFCFVPAGSFEMGSGVGQDERSVHSVWLPAFWVAFVPVTVADWWRFVEAGGCTQAHYWVQSDSTDLGSGPARVGWGAQQDSEDHPVRNLTWYEARAYAAWLAETTGRSVALPTEAEWEKAAGWDPEIGRMRRYPWGDAPDVMRCNVKESGLEDTTPVGRYSPVGDSPCGAQDMAGNVFEWTSTQHRPYPYDAGDGREVASGDRPRVLRGGAFNRSIDEASCAYRHQLDPASGPVPD